MHKILSHWLSDLDSFDRAGLSTMQKKKKPQHNTRRKTKKQNKEKEKKIKFSF